MRDFCYDLAAALPTLLATGKHGKLVAAIKRAMSTASGYQDLSDARDALLLLRRLTKEKDISSRFAEGDLGIMTGALFAQAVILYTRATDTKPIERQKWFGRDKLSGEDRQFHQEVMSLRDHALAHFGRAAELTDGALVKEALVMERDENAVKIAFYSSRAQNRAAFAARLLTLVERVQALAYDATQARYADLGAALAVASKFDPAVPALMRGFAFDGEGFFPTKGWQDRVAQGPVPGTMTLHASVAKPDR